jgi:molybdate/tungstate transport system substrate-binding protein
MKPIGHAALRWLAALGVSFAGAAATPSSAAEPVTLNVFAAGTLAVPFKEIDDIVQRDYPQLAVHPQFGGSVKMARQIIDLHQPADILAVADYSVIPKYLFGGEGRPAHAAWYAGFARNAITFVFTERSRFAVEITNTNWYRVLARPGVEIGRSNPDTDPSGYQTLQMLSLAEHYYGVPGLAAKILANAPETNIRDTETTLISALQLGQIDYLAIYRSDARQHGFRYLELPAAIDLGDPGFAADYAKGTAHTKNGDLVGKPIVYAVTAVIGAEHVDWADKYVALVLGPQGQAVMQKNGFDPLAPAYAVNGDKMPAGLRALVKPWPGR